MVPVQTLHVFVAFLKGINVGSYNRKIRMADLKGMFESTGFSSVRTYIQSGNVVFKAEGEKESLAAGIESEILNRFSVEVPAILRTRDEIEEITGAMSFDETLGKDAQFPVLHVALSGSPLEKDDVDKLSTYVKGEERLVCTGSEIYLYLPYGVHSSKLAAAIQRLSIPVTVRNWNTVQKLMKLTYEIE